MEITHVGTKRKSELLDIALDLFSKSGYIDTSIQEIISTAGVSKGAFYHYFKSKEDVLDQIIDRYINEIVDLSNKIAEDPNLSALKKYNLLFTEVQKRRIVNRGKFMFLLKMMLSEKNSLFINRYTEKTIKMVILPYRKILDQGMAEGVFHINDPEATAELIIRFGTIYRTKLAGMYLQVQYQPDIIKEIQKTINFIQDTVERLLGVNPGTFIFISESFKGQFRI